MEDVSFDKKIDKARKLMKASNRFIDQLIIKNQKMINQVEFLLRDLTKINAKF